MANIKETEDFLVAGFAVAGAIRKAVQDGRVDVSDAVDIATDSEVREAILEAADGAGQVPAELKDLDLGEVLQLVKRVIDELEVAFDDSPTA